MNENEKRQKIFFALTVACCALIIWPVRTSFAIGVAFAYVSEGGLYWLEKRFKTHSERSRWILASLFVITAFLLFVVPFVSLIYTGVSKAVVFFSAESESVSLPELSNKGAVFLRDQLTNFGIDLNLADLLGRLNSTVAQVSQQALGVLGKFLQGTPQFLLDIFLMLLVWIFFLVEGRRWRAKLLPKLLPWERERDVIASTTGDILRGAIVSNILVSLIQATLLFIVFLIVGMKEILVWTIFAFFSSFVPYIGTMLVIVVSSGYSYATGDKTGAIIILASALVVTSVDNFLRPIFMKGSSQMSFFWLLVAFIGGVEIFGVPGIVLGPLAFAIFARNLQSSDGLPPPIDVRHPMV